MQTRHQQSSSKDRSVSSLNVHPRILVGLRRAGLNRVSSVLTLSAGDLSRRTGLPHSDVQSLLEAVSKALFPKYATHSTAFNLYKDNTTSLCLSTGCSHLNEFLCGGLIVPGLNEVAGTSAAGKTQFCLQLCLNVQLPGDQGGLDGGAVYVCTEDAFPHKRLQQMIEVFTKKHRQRKPSLSDNIYVEHAATISSLSMQVQYKLPSLLAQHSIRLIVVDSIAALFRAEFTESQSAQRAQLLRAFGAQLKQLSNDFNAALVCVNQVTAAMEVDSVSGVKPALGLTWAEQVTVRLMMTRNEGVEGEEEIQQDKDPVLRELEVVFAPHLPRKQTQFYIDLDGVHGAKKESN